MPAQATPDSGITPDSPPQLRVPRLRAAMANGEFRAVFQPKCDIASGTIVGAEALARWLPERTDAISPDQFIDFLERHGMIVTFDRMMLTEVCRHLHTMHEQGRAVVPTSVNLSRAHLASDDTMRDTLYQIDRAFDQWHIDPQWVSWEITEREIGCVHGDAPDIQSSTSIAATPSAQEDSQLARRLDTLIDALHQRGCLVELDDFGAGASTLRTVAMHAFDVIKIDRSLTMLIPGKRANAIIAAITTMAAELDMQVIAEGVTTCDQAHALLTLGCATAQGYYYDKPMSPEDFAALPALRR